LDCGWWISPFLMALKTAGANMLNLILFLVNWWISPLLMS
jgi:hypothetical protein